MGRVIVSSKYHKIVFFCQTLGQGSDFVYSLSQEDKKKNTPLKKKRKKEKGCTKVTDFDT